MLDIEAYGGANIRSIQTTFDELPVISKTIFFTGCSIRCPDCQNAALWRPVPDDYMPYDDILSATKSALTKWVVLLGGEPTDQLDTCLAIMRDLPDMKFAMYTGLTEPQLARILPAWPPNLLLVKVGPWLGPGPGRLGAGQYYITPGKPDPDIAGLFDEKKAAISGMQHKP
jgi:hypothetical protein